MKTWAFNIDLFLRMDKVLDITFAEIARRTGVLQPAISRYTQQECVVSVDTLIKMCNALRMPFRYFVEEDGVSVIPERERATVPLDEWSQIQWLGKRAESVFNASHITWTKVAGTMGLVKGQNAKKRFTNGARRFPINSFLATCTKLQVSPWEFVSDTNLQAAKQGGARQKPARAIQQEPADVKRLKDTVAELNAKLDKLQADNAAMQRKMDAMLRSMEEMQQNYRAINYGPVQENNFHIHKAAEPGDKQKPEE